MQNELDEIKEILQENRGMALTDFTEKLVSISEFSQGKAGKIFADVAKNNAEYIVLKNNQPTAVVMSMDEYRETQRQLTLLTEYVKRLEEK